MARVGHLRPWPVWRLHAQGGMIPSVPVLRFTPQLSRFTPVPEVATDATTLRQALEAAFALNPALRGYVLDEQGDLRPHVFAFVDGRRCSGADPLATPLTSDSQVWVLQALTGG